MTEMKNSILSQVLDQQARARRRGSCACLSKTLYKSSVEFVSQKMTDSVTIILILII